MASRIKGITVEIGGDTTGLDKALKSVNTTIKNTQSSLKDVNKLLKLDPSNTELLSQKQKLLKDAIGATKEKLDSLKAAQEQAKAQLGCRRPDKAGPGFSLPVVCLEEHSDKGHHHDVLCPE